MASTRSELGFRPHVEASFSFLSEQYGFRIVAGDDTLVRYENDQVFVNIYHGRQSYSVSFELGLVALPAYKYYPEEFAALYGLREETFFQASTPERVGQYVQKLADLLRNHGGTLLRGDVAEFGRLYEVRDARATAVTRDYTVRAMREKADLAWKRRDYPAVIEALAAIGDEMSPAEQQKLQYAQKRLRPG